jgi:hypothetical protein
MGAHVVSQDDVKSPGSDGASPYRRGFLLHCLATALFAVDLVDQSPGVHGGSRRKPGCREKPRFGRSLTLPARVSSALPRHGVVCRRLGQSIA